MRERTSERAVTMMTGMAQILRIRPHTSKPSWSGSPRSSSTTANGSAWSGSRALRASSPLRACTTDRPCLASTADRAAAT